MKIGLLIDSLYNPYEAHLWQDLVKLAAEKGILLSCFTVGKMDEEYNLNKYSEMFYSMLHPGNFDGLIVFSNTIASSVSRQKLEDFFHSLHPIPAVSIGVPIEGIPSVLVANNIGIDGLMSHLIEVHGYRKLAFVRGSEGNYEADCRFSSYINILGQYGIPFDERLVVSGNFVKQTGIGAVRILLDERKVSFDVLMGANDNIALSAMRELQKRGFKVPEDVAVTGFDDITESRCNIQPLTTIRQPIYEIARSSLELLTARIGGKETPAKLVLPVELKVRRTCGCYLHGEEIDDSSWTIHPDWTPEEMNSRMMKYMVTQMDLYFRYYTSASALEGWAESIIYSLSNTLVNYSNNKSFFLTLENVILESLEGGIETLQWYPVISQIFKEYRKYSSPKTGDKLDLLWKRALNIIGNIADYRVIHSNLDYKDLNMRLQSLGDAFINIHDLNQLTDIIAAQFQEINIRRFFMSQYLGKKEREFARLLIGFTDEDNFTAITDHSRFPLEDILPQQCKNSSEPLLIYPLHFPDVTFGYVVFTVSTLESALFESITMYLNNSLLSANFVNKARQQTLELETKARLQNMILKSTNRKLLDEKAEREKAQSLLEEKNREIEDLRKQLELTSRLDNLTSLYNKEALFDFLTKEVNRTKRNIWRIDKEFKEVSRRESPPPSENLKNHFCFFSLLILEIDNFSRILEEFGRQFADIVLVSVGRVFKRGDVFRKEDIPGRYEHNKFIIILPNTNSRNAYHAACRVVDGIGKIEFVNDVHITVSIGIAEFESRDENHQNVIKIAEQALEQSKTSGGNTITVFGDSAK